MVKRLYLDGCSLVYGQGLERNQSLAHLFEHNGGYNVLDMSRCGKSNIAIAMDTYQNYDNFDIFVLGFTFSSRFGIKYHDQNLDFYTGHAKNSFGLNSQELDLAQIEIYKYFYTVFDQPYCNNLSDMLIDTLVSFLLLQNKQVVGFSWESRNTKKPLYYPYYGPVDRLNDGHLNANGTEKLFNFLQNIISNE